MSACSVYICNMLMCNMCIMEARRALQCKPESRGVGVRRALVCKARCALGHTHRPWHNEAVDLQEEDEASPILDVRQHPAAVEVDPDEHRYYHVVVEV